MPKTVAGLHEYITETVESTLSNNPTAQDLLETLRLKDVPSPSAFLPAPVWAALKPLASTLLHDTSVGTLPPALREKFGVEWGRDDELRLSAIRVAVRQASRLVPDIIMQYPMAHEARKSARQYRRKNPK